MKKKMKYNMKPRHSRHDFPSENPSRIVLTARDQISSNGLPELDENPPAYDTMYPGVLNQGFVENQRDHVILHQSYLLQSVDTKTRSNKDNVGTISGYISEKEESGRKKGSVKNEKKGRYLEHKVTLGEFSKSTKEKIITQATGLRKTASQALNEFCQTTTAHGFSHVVEPDLHVVFKALWMVITLVSVCILVMMAYQVTEAAFITRSPTTEIHNMDNRATGIALPHLTVCSLSGFWKSKLEEYKISNKLASYLLLSIRGPTIISDDLAINPKGNLLLKYDLEVYLKEQNVTLTELILKLSPECEDVINVCYIADVMYPRHTFFSTVITSSGVCYTTIQKNSSVITQEIAGIYGGLKIVFPITEAEYMEYDPKVVFTPWLAEEGIQISLSDYTMTPSVSANMNPIRIAPNMAATVALSLETVDHRERYMSIWPWLSKYPSCLSKEEYLEQTEEEIAYTENNLYTTLQNRDCLLEASNCTLIPSMFENDTTDECQPQHILDQYIVWQNDKSGFHECVQEKLTECELSRGKLCITNKYSQQLSYTSLYNHSLRNLQNSGFLPQGSISVVTIFYSHLKYTELLERTPDFMTWFSDLGGQMGLFLGASFITLVELLFTILYIIRLSVSRASKILRNKILKPRNSKTKSKENK